VVDELGTSILITSTKLIEQIEQIDDELSTADSKDKLELKHICAMYVSKLKNETHKFSIEFSPLAARRVPLS
jgi:ABC-type Zn uptake system ZnuABC Zn-binding protein ZnuA